MQVSPFPPDRNGSMWRGFPFSTLTPIAIGEPESYPPKEQPVGGLTSLQLPSIACTLHAISETFGGEVGSPSIEDSRPLPIEGRLRLPSIASMWSGFTSCCEVIFPKPEFSLNEIVMDQGAEISTIPKNQDQPTSGESMLTAPLQSPSNSLQHAENFTNSFLLFSTEADSLINEIKYSLNAFDVAKYQFFIPWTEQPGRELVKQLCLQIAQAKTQLVSIKKIAQLLGHLPILLICTSSSLHPKIHYFFRRFLEWLKGIYDWGDSLLGDLTQKGEDPTMEVLHDFLYYWMEVILWRYNLVQRGLLETKDNIWELQQQVLFNNFQSTEIPQASRPGFLPAPETKLGEQGFGPEIVQVESALLIPTESACVELSGHNGHAMIATIPNDTLTPTSLQTQTAEFSAGDFFGPELSGEDIDFQIVGVSQLEVPQALLEVFSPTITPLSNLWRGVAIENNVILQTLDLGGTNQQTMSSFVAGEEQPACDIYPAIESVQVKLGLQ